MINIIGAGLAGLSAALTLAENGVRCRLISAQSSERAQSVLAEGGINAALDTMGENDSRELHFEETMKGGAYLADPNAVRSLCFGAPETVERLIRLGVPFNRNADGSLMLRSFGGQKKKRTAFARSSTGKMIMAALTDEVRKYEARRLVERLSHHVFIRPLISGGECIGVRIKDSFTGEVRDLYGRVTAAFGGLCGLFPEMTTGTVTNSGNAAAVLFSQGVKLGNLEMIQYHPTTVGIPGKRCLISEAARGEGGRLYTVKDGSPWYFMEEKYPELKNLMPRDVVSREIFFAEREHGDVYLDMRGIPAEAWRGKLSDLRAEIMHYFPLDPVRDPVPVQPGIHYFMGGIYVNERHETSVKGLYAAGECACQYHGANRLGGNSMLGALFGGHTAALTAMEEDTGENGEKLCGEKDIFDCVSSVSFDEKLRGILSGGLGIVRCEEDLRVALEALGELDCKNAVEAARKELSRAMLLSALERKESRGAHCRSDAPGALEEYRKTTVCEYFGEKVNISFADIPERRQL